MIDKLIAILKNLQEKDSSFLPIDFRYGDYSDLGIKYIDEVELGSGRWTAYILTIVHFKGHLYAIAWERGLTEMQENEFYPVEGAVHEVERQEKIVYTYKKK